VRQQTYLDISAAQDKESFERLLVAFAGELDFGLITGTLVVERPGRPADCYHLGNTPAAFSETYASAAVGRRDPVLTRLKRVSTPFVYDQSMYLNESAIDLWDAQAPFGFQTGIAMALHMAGGKHFLLGVDRAKALPKSDRSITRLMADLQLLAVHAQEAAIRVLLPPEAHDVVVSLTPREREVLKWTIEGKSGWAVAQILSMSQNTVNFHVQNAIKKLGVANKHQAAAKALALGLI
jgi:DNA-binding CsgD family transcriptional regulator